MSTQITIRGTSRQDFTSPGFMAQDNSLIVDLARNATWYGGFHATGHFGLDGFTINGGPGATFMNTHSDALYSGGSSVVNAVVGGTGSFTVHSGATLTFNKAVGAGQTVDVINQASSGKLQLNDPKHFAGNVHLDGGLVNLSGLPNAASYSFQNDILSIFGAAGGSIDTLHMVGSSAFIVEKTTTGVSIHSASLTWFNDQGTPMPVHTT